MAKETVFTYKIKVDGKEVETSVNTINGFQQRLGDLYKKLNNTPINSKEWVNLQKEIKRTEGALDTAKNSQLSFIDQLAGLPGILGTVGQSVQGVGKFFGNFNMLLKASPLGLLAVIIAKVVDKLSNMAGVLDPLNKITEVFSGVIGNLANLVMKPLIFVIEGVVSGVEKLGNIFGEIIGKGADYGDVLSKIGDDLNNLEDSQAAFDLQLSKSNRQLQEAREIAADETKSIEERKQALIDAGEKEKQIAKENRERATQRARLQAQQLAAELGFNAQRIKEIGSYDEKQLESFAKEIDGFKNLNREKLNSLYGYIGTVEEISANEAKINKKVQGQLKGLQKEQDAEAKARAQEAMAAAKERRQNQIQDLDAEIKLLTSFRKDNEMKDAQYYQNIEKQLRDYYKRKNELEDKDKKLTKAQLENRRREQEEAIKKGIQGLIDANDKETKLNADLQKSTEELANAKKGIITDELLLVQQQQTDLEIAFEKEKTRLENDLELKKKIYGEESDEFKNAQIAKNNAEAAFINKSNQNNQKIQSLVKSRNERLKNLDMILEQERNDGLQDGLEKQLLIINDGEKKKVDAYKKSLDEAVKNGDLTLEEAATKLANYSALVAQKTREATKKAIGEDFVKQITQGVDAAISGTTTGFFKTFGMIDGARKKLDEGFKAGTISLEKYQEGIIALNSKLNAQFDKMSVALQAVGGAASAAAQAFGEESAAGRVLIKVSQGIALAETGVALAKSLAGLGEAIKKPFPANVVAVAATLGLIGTAFAQARALFAKQVPEAQGMEEPRQLATGGMVMGAGTGTSDSIPARLSNGESVINARSTAMFAPLLSAINQAGGGKAFAFGGVVSPQEIMAQQQSASLIQALSQSQEQPIKTFVVAQDMTSMQMFDRAQKSRSTL